MLRMLVVDDEYMICSLINNIVDWTSLEIEYIGSVTDSNNALQVIEDKHPDIVLIDVCMPGMSGLDIIEQVTNKKLAVKFIIISGYSRFEYAYSAIKFGVEDFLLKPLDKNELNQTISRVADQIRLSRNISAQTMKQKSSSRNALIDALLGNFLSSGALTLSNINSQYYMHFREGSFLVCIVIVDNCGTNGSSISNILMSIKNSIDRWLSEICFDYLSTIHGNYIYTILNFKAAEGQKVKLKLSNFLNEALRFLSPYRFSKATLCSGCVTEDISCLPLSFQSASLMVSSRILLGTNRWLSYEEHPYKLEDKDRIIPPTLPKNLEEYFETLNFEAALEASLSTFEKALPVFDSRPYDIIQYTLDYASAILLRLKEVFPLCEALIECFDSISEALPYCISIDELRDCLQNQLTHAFKLVWNYTDTENVHIISAVKEYILKHLDNRIVLEDIAQEVYLNPAYLGALFKKKSGVTFSAYLTNIRIHEAKKLLKDMRYSIADISCKTGYKDNKHFRNVFKKVVGITPTEYRKLFGSYSKNSE